MIQLPRELELLRLLPILRRTASPPFWLAATFRFPIRQRPMFDSVTSRSFSRKSENLKIQSDPRTLSSKRRFYVTTRRRRHDEISNRPRSGSSHPQSSYPVGNLVCGSIGLRLPLSSSSPYTSVCKGWRLTSRISIQITLLQEQRIALHHVVLFRSTTNQRPTRDLGSVNKLTARDMARRPIHHLKDNPYPSGSHQIFKSCEQIISAGCLQVKS